MKRRAAPAHVAMAFVMAACTAPSAAVPIPAAAPLSFTVAVQWSLEPDAEGARIVRTDLGYTVGVQSLEIGIGTLELVPCAEESSSMIGMARWFTTTSVAHADHVWDSDSSLITPNVAIAVASPLTRDLGGSTASGAEYCELFWTLVAVDDSSGEASLRGASARLRGWVQAPGGSERVAIDHEIRLGEGALIPLIGSWSPTSSVQLTLSPELSFDGIDFDDLSDSEIVYELVRNLGNTSTAGFRAQGE